jgi:PAS domain S-box-containing protein
MLAVILPGINRGQILISDPGFPLYFLASLIAAVAYFVSRTRWYKTASWMAVILSSVAIFASTFIEPEPGQIPGLFFLIIPVILSGMLLPIRSIAVLVLLQIAGLLALPFVRPHTTWSESIAFPLAFHLLASVLIVLVARYRNLVEHERQADLERRIVERTQELTQVNRDLQEEVKQRERAEKTLAEERNWLRTLMDIIPDYIFVKDTQRQFVLVNTAWAKNNAGAEEANQVIGKTDYDYFSKALADGFYADEVNILQSGHAMIDKEEVNAHPGQTERWMLTTKVPLVDNSGQIVGLVGISRDITRRKQMEEALQNAHAEMEQRVIERTEELSRANTELQREIVERVQIEQQLKYQANLLQNVTDAIVATDIELKIRSWNLAAKQIYGWNVEEARGHRVDVLLTQNPAPDIQQHVLKDGYWRGEVRHRRKDGSHVQILSSVSLVRDSAGTPVGTVAVNRDITYHKLAEMAEREQRLLAEALRDSAAAINSTLDLHEVLDRILIQVERVFPCDTSNIMLIDSNVAHVVHSRGYNEHGFETEDMLTLRFPIQEVENLCEMYKTGQPSLIQDTLDYPDWRRLNQTAWIRSYVAAPIRIEGDVIGFINLDNARVNAFSQEHAERLQAFANQAGIAIQNARLYDAVKDYATQLEKRVAERTAQVERQRAQLQTILDAMNEGIVGIMFDADMKSQTRLTNRALTTLLGYQPDEWDYSLLRSESMTPEEAADIVSVYRRSIEAEGFWQWQSKMRRKDGSEFDAYLTATRVDDPNGNMIGEVIVIRDVSQEKVLQEQRSRFVANASHELRTPITNLLTRLYLLDRQPERLPEHLEILENVAERMRNLVEDLLEHSRFERGVIPLQRTEVDLRALLVEVIRIQQPEADMKPIALSCQIPESPLIINADPGRMTQVLTNLITNAINYTPEGGQVNIECVVEEDHAAGNSAVVVHIQDSGIGISPDLLPNIFRPFYRGSEHTNGTGLGLSIAKEIVEMHGGTISVESHLGTGSRFSVRLSLIASTLDSNRHVS